MTRNKTCSCGNICSEVNSFMRTKNIA